MTFSYIGIAKMYIMFSATDLDVASYEMEQQFVHPNRSFLILWMNRLINENHFYTVANIIIMFSFHLQIHAVSRVHFALYCKVFIKVCQLQ